MVPTPENITEVANARLKAIQERAREIALAYGGARRQDEHLISNVITRATRFASRAGTAQAAVQWAIMDMTPYDALEPTHEGEGI